MPDLNENRGMRPPLGSTVVEVPEATDRGCIVVERPRGVGHVEQIWVDSSSFLIRRVVEPRHPLGPPPPDAIERLKASHPEHAEEIAQRFAARPAREPVDVESITDYEPALDVIIPAMQLRFTPPGEG
jgi:hypothetical protein